MTRRPFLAAVGAFFVVVLIAAAVGLALASGSEARPPRPAPTTSSTTTSTRPLLAGEWICLDAEGHEVYTGDEEAADLGGCHR